MNYVRSMLQDYRNVYGQNPIGSNAEITAALMGKNARRSQFIRSDDPNLNEHGELVDPWGTAYFLHQISGQLMEVRSAGPDQSMWTADDLLVR